MMLRNRSVSEQLIIFVGHYVTKPETGLNYDYELNQIFFDDLGIRKPDHFLNAAGQSGAETIGNVIIAVDRKLAQTEPAAFKK